MKEKFTIDGADFLFSKHPSPMWIVATSDLSILKMNDAALSLFRLKRQLPRNFKMDALFPEDVSIIKIALRKKQQRFFVVGTLIHRVGKNIIYLYTQAKKITWQKKPAFVLVGNNVSASIESEQALRDFHHAITNSSIVSRADTTGLITEINDNFLRISGYSEQELLGQNHRIINSGYHPRSFWIDMWRTIVSGQSWRGEVKNKAKDGSFYWVDTFIMPLLDKEGQIKEFLSVRNDITSKKQAEETLLRSEQKHRRLYNNLPEMYFTLDNSLKVTLVNDNGALQLGYLPTDIIGKSVLNLSPNEEHQSIIDHVKRCFDNPYQIVEWQTKKLRKDGEQVRVHELGWSELNLDNEQRVNVISEDITIHEKSRDEIFKQKELSNTIINSLPGVFYLFNEAGEFLRWNKNFESVTGYSGEEIRSMLPTDFFDGRDKEFIFERISKVFEEGSADAEADFFTKNKEKLPFYFTGRLITYEDQRCVIGMGIDMTQQKVTSQQLKLAIMASRLGIWTVDFRTQTLSGDDRIEEIWGIPAQQLSLEAYWKTVYPDDRLVKQAEDLKRMTSREVSYQSEFRIVRPDGEIRYVRSQGLFFRNEDGKPLHGVSVIYDQTQQKLYESGLLKTLQEKDMLIREMHHRVKNNLQLISSMLYLKMLAWDKTDPVVFMTNMREKIKSVALVHERLLQSESHSSIDINDYILKLIHDLEITYYRQDLVLNLKADIDEFKLTTDYATNLGQLVNELVTNAIKHAFEGRDRGTIDISLKQNDSACMLIVGDDGVGLPSTVNFFNPNTYGMQLVQIFVRQLQGSIEVDMEQGTKYTITFNV